MRTLLVRSLLPILFAVLSIPQTHAAPTVGLSPSRSSLDADWKFSQGDPSTAKDAAFDDSAWRALDLPHDWGIEGPIDRKNPTGGAGGFFPAGIGWYRHHFDAPEAWRGQHVSVEFEGVYMNAEIFLNGESIGKQAYGYTTFFVDLDARLKYGEPNVLAVRVDNSQQINSRWYSGSGIYRHVWLHVAGPLHILPFGVSVSASDITPAGANIKVQVRATVKSPRVEARPSRLECEIVSPEGGRVAHREVTLPATTQLEYSADLTVANPVLWSPESPRLYHLRTRLLADDTLLDQRDTAFGIRSLAWSAEKGFLLNGQSIKLCGGCVHHDNGILGAAAFDQAEERRVRSLKEAGFNAIRAAHNPPSPAFLDACDRLGMLVLDEAFDCWEKGKNAYDYHVVFKEQWQHDLDTMVERDRNHPSVVIWSIGNEVDERATPDGARLGAMLADHLRWLDPTRPVTSAICPVGKRPWSDTDGLFAALDIGGYNYTLENAAGNSAPNPPRSPEVQTHAADHARLPGRVMMSTESYPHDTFGYHDLVEHYPYIIGDFVWTALDYLGESGIGRSYVEAGVSPEHGSGEMFPAHGGSCGDLDLTETRRPVSHYRNILWDRGEKIYMAVQEPPRADGKQIHQTRWSLPELRESWTWPGQEGKELDVEVYTKASTVRLSLDGKALGEVPVTRAGQFRATFKVPYAAGILKAQALENGAIVAECTLTTTGAPAELRLTPNCSECFKADGQSLSFVNVEIVDKDGNLCPDAAQEVRINLDGPGILAGFGNGDLSTNEPYFGNTHHVFQGRALLVVRSTHQTGDVHVVATTDGLPPADATIKAQSAE